ncbi:BA14K family protein [Bartonella sp. CB189]|uniref:BA14K family protein n=1 Tax=Bartonella sp. CB189 TaxID=3112254 RepID=UPI002F96A239
MFIIKSLCYALVVLFIGSILIIITHITHFTEKSNAEIKELYQSSIQEKWMPLIVTGRRELNGFKGYRNYRVGYHRYSDNWWYPKIAFTKLPNLDENHRSLKEESASKKVFLAPPLEEKEPWMFKQHIDSCMLRYRSYNKNDNSYQPFHGPRKQCFSRVFKG